MRFDESKYPIKAEPWDIEEGQREMDLSFTFRPEYDYSKDVDTYVPRWIMPPITEHPGKPGAQLATEQRQLRRSVRVGRKIVSMPFTRYVRAVDPMGNVLPLTVSSVAPGPEYPDGNDGLGNENITLAQKRRRGWLVLMEDEYVRGRTGNEYIAWCLAVAEKRRIAHARYEREEAKNFTSQAMRQQENLQRETNDMQKRMFAEFGETIANAMKSVVTTASGKKAKEVD